MLENSKLMLIPSFQALAKMKESKVHCGASTFSTYKLD